MPNAQQEWVGKRFIARRRFSFIDRDVAPGEEFTFTQRYADMGIQPQPWLDRGRAELVDEPTARPWDTPAIPPEVDRDPTVGRRGRKRYHAPDPEPDLTPGPEAPFSFTGDVDNDQAPGEPEGGE